MFPDMKITYLLSQLSSGNLCAYLSVTNSKMIGESFILKVHVWYIPTITLFDGFSQQKSRKYGF